MRLACKLNDYTFLTEHETDDDGDVHAKMCLVSLAHYYLTDTSDIRLSHMPHAAPGKLNFRFIRAHNLQCRTRRPTNPRSLGRGLSQNTIGNSHHTSQVYRVHVLSLSPRGCNNSDNDRH